MSQADLNRVRDDLATMKRVVGVGLPFGRADVGLSLTWAAAGVPLAVCVAFTPVDQATFGLLLVVPAVAVLALSGMVAKKYHQHREKNPVRWREHKFQWVAAGVLVPLFAGFVLWGLNRGLSPEALTLTALFMAGLGMLVLPIIDRSRMFYAGWAVCTLLFAVTAPLFGHRYVGVSVGLWLFFSGLSAAGIMSRQLRRSATEHATD